MRSNCCILFFIFFCRDRGIIFDLFSGFVGNVIALIAAAQTEARVFFTWLLQKIQMCDVCRLLLLF